MTNSDIKYIVKNILKDEIDKITPLSSAKLISGAGTYFVNPLTRRFKFDTKNEILECYYCEIYDGPIHSTWKEGRNYDELNDTRFKYLFDPETLEPYIDYISFDAIDSITLNEVTK